jgi:outer membrane protein
MVVRWTPLVAGLMVAGCVAVWGPGPAIAQEGGEPAADFVEVPTVVREDASEVSEMPPATAPAAPDASAAAPTEGPLSPRAVGTRRVLLDDLYLSTGVAEPTDRTFRGLLGIDPAADAPVPMAGAAGPFDLEPDESELFTTDDLERIDIQPDPDPGLADLSLADCVRTALFSNYGLADEARSLASSSSSRRAARANFIPFVDLVYETRYQESRVGRTRRDERDLGIPEEEQSTFRERRGTEDSVEARIGQNLPWGGDLSLNVGGSYARDKVVRFESMENQDREVDRVAVTHEYRSDVSLGYNQPLLRGAGWTIGTLDLKRSQLGEMRQAIAFQLSQRELALEVIRNYYSVIQAQLDLSVSREAVEEVNRFLGETKTLFELGRIAESEISRAEIQFLQEKQRFIDRVQAVESRLDTLLDSLGLPLRARLTLAQVEGQLIDLRLAHIPALEEAIQEALSSRLELSRSAISVEEARLSLENAENDLLPDVNASANWVGSDTGVNGDEAGDFADELRWDVGLSVLVPLPNLQRREARWRAKLALESALNQQEEQRRSTMREVKGAYRDLQASRARVTILARTVEQARRSLALENARFETGLNTSTDVRNAQDDLFSAQVDYNSALLSLQIDLASLFRAIGRPIA